MFQWSQPTNENPSYVSSMTTQSSNQNSKLIRYTNSDTSTQTISLGNESKYHTCISPATAYSMLKCMYT